MVSRKVNYDIHNLYDVSSHLEIKLRDITKILCADTRLKDRVLSLSDYLGIPRDDVTYLKKNGRSEPREVIQATLEYWMSINGDKATVKVLQATLRKQSFLNLVGKLKPYLEHRIVPDCDVKPFQDEDMDQDDGCPPDDSSANLDDQIANMTSGMNMEENDNEGYSTKDTIVIDGLDDFGDIERDKKNVQIILDGHKYPMRVVDAKRFQGPNKKLDSLKIKLKAKDKVKWGLKSLMNRVLPGLMKSETLSQHGVIVSKFEPNVHSRKKPTKLGFLIGWTGKLIGMGLHVVANQFENLPIQDFPH